MSNKLPASMKNSAGAWMVVDVRHDVEVLQGMARTYAMYASSFPALFSSEQSYTLGELARRLDERAATVEALLVQLPGAIPGEWAAESER